jgi:hypothetical protein
MKRFILTFALLLGFAYVASADERPIELSQMPKAAQTFIANNFAGKALLYANVDREILDTDYEVRLEDGTQIDFNVSGGTQFNADGIEIKVVNLPPIPTYSVLAIYADKYQDRIAPPEKFTIYGIKNFDRFKERLERAMM